MLKPKTSSLFNLEKVFVPRNWRYTTLCKTSRYNTFSATVLCKYLVFSVWQRIHCRALFKKKTTGFGKRHGTNIISSRNEPQRPWLIEVPCKRKQRSLMWVARSIIQASSHSTFFEIHPMLEFRWCCILMQPECSQSIWHRLDRTSSFRYCLYLRCKNSKTKWWCVAFWI